MPSAGSDLDLDRMVQRAGATSAPRPASPARRARWVLLVSIVVTLALYVLPFGGFIARPLMYLSTLVHELGHGLAAMLSGAEFARLEMFADGSGFAMTTRSSNWQQAVTLAGGLLGPAIAAAIGFAAARRGSWSRWFLAAIGLLLVWAMVFKIRTGFGLVVAGSVVVGALLTAWRARPDRAQLILGFLSVQLALSVFSRGDYLFTESAMSGGSVHPSDSAQLAQALAGPYWLWGGVCAVFSLGALALGAWLMLRGVARRPRG